MDSHFEDGFIYLALVIILNGIARGAMAGMAAVRRTTIRNIAIDPVWRMRFSTSMVRE